MYNDHQVIQFLVTDTPQLRVNTSMTTCELQDVYQTVTYKQK